MYVIVGVIGIVASFILWVITAPWVAASILWVEQHYPQVAGTRAIKISEVIICALQVSACMALAFWIAWLIVE